MGSVKITAVYSPSDIVDAMAEAHRIVGEAAEEVFRGGDITPAVVKSTIDEYEYVFRKLLPGLC